MTAAPLQTETHKLRVALVGCGQIADAHLSEIRKLSSAEAVAVCDNYRDLAIQAAARFQVPGVYDNFTQMLDEVRPDVVHITTPAHTHGALALQVLAAGAHVYVEKPFTVDVAECDRVLAAARQQDRLVCIGHDQVFDPIWLECRQLVESGEIGRVQHVDALMCYSIDGPFGAQVMADPQHWVRRLPGGLFQNTISHPLYRMTDFLLDEQPEIWATWFTKKPGDPIPTELRAHLRGEDVTGNLLFTSTTRPFQRVVRLYGTKGGLEVDYDAQAIRMYRPLALPGAFGKLEAPARHLREAFRNLRRNFAKFLRGKIQYFGGMNELFRRFYDSILKGSPVPIPASEIRRVTFLLDEIFRHCQQNGSSTGTANSRGAVDTVCLPNSVTSPPQIRENNPVQVS